MGLSLSCKRGNLQWVSARVENAEHHDHLHHQHGKEDRAMSGFAGLPEQPTRELQLQSESLSEKKKKKNKKPWKAQKIHASSLCVHMWAHTNHKSNTFSWIHQKDSSLSLVASS